MEAEYWRNIKLFLKITRSSINYSMGRIKNMNINELSEMSLKESSFLLHVLNFDLSGLKYICKEFFLTGKIIR